MTRPIHRVDYELAYCAWAMIAPAWVAQLPVPQLAPWFALFADVVRAGVAPQPGDLPGQHYRRAIIAGATPEDPFPGDVRGKALLVESAARRLPAERLAALGSPVVVVRALGPAIAVVPTARAS